MPSVSDRVGAIADQQAPPISTSSVGQSTEAELINHSTSAAPVESITKPPLRGMLNTFEALRYRNFRLMWIGSFFSSAGQWIQQVTIGWVVYDITGSRALLGAINGVRSVPMLFLSPISGVAADRLNRKGLMIATQVFLTVMSFLLAIDIVLGKLEIWHLFVFTFLSGAAWAFNMPVRQSVVFDLVPRHVFPNAFALNSVAFNFTRILGPTAAGFLILWLGPQGNFFVQGIAYLLITISLMMVVLPKNLARDGKKKENVMKSLTEGFHYVAKGPVIRTLMFMGLFPVFFVFPYMALLPVFAKDVFHGGPRAYGLLLSVSGVGGVLGGLFTASLGKFEKRGILQLVSMFLFGAGVVLFSFMNNLWAGAIVLIITGFSQMVFMTINQTLLQTNIPDELRGRVTSIYMLNQGLVPLGTVVAAIGADVIGDQQIVFIMGITCAVLAILIAICAPQVRNMRLVGAADKHYQGDGGMGR